MANGFDGHSLKILVCAQRDSGLLESILGATNQNKMAIEQTQAGGTALAMFGLSDDGMKHNASQQNSF